jgi:hypothetical protein
MLTQAYSIGTGDCTNHRVRLNLLKFGREIFSDGRPITSQRAGITLRYLLYDATGRGIGQHARFVQPRMHSFFTIAAAHRIVERQQTSHVGEAKMGSTEITGPTFLAGKRHLSLQTQQSGWGKRRPFSVTQQTVARDENTTTRARNSQPNEDSIALNPMLLAARMGEFGLGQP